MVTDWDNVGRMCWEQQVCPDIKDAARLAVQCGNDLMMSTPTFFDGAIQAVAEGLLTEAQIDEVVGRILALKFKMGLFENPRRPDVARQKVVVGCETHRAANLEVARKSIVLLQNNGLLPLKKEKIASIAVVGPNADNPHAQLGDWAGKSGQAKWLLDGHPRECVTTVLDGLRRLSDAALTVRYEKGADIISAENKDKTDAIFKTDPLSMSEAEEEMIERALRLAAGSDVVVAVVGDDLPLIGETKSTATLELQGGQIPLLEALCALDKPLVVVLINSKPLVLPPCIHNTAAILEVFNPGMEGGLAIAETLLGENSPSGRLPVSIPYHVGQQPIYYHQIRGQHGDSYADLSQKPHFPFGFGLTYTRFHYRDLRINTPTLRANDLFECSVVLENIGESEGTETVQLYIRDEVTSATWAERELKHFEKITLLPGEKRTVCLTCEASEFSIVNAAGRRVVEPGTFTAMVGPNSDFEHLLKASFEVMG